MSNAATTAPTTVKQEARQHPIIFLDVDGVLNNTATEPAFGGLDDGMVQLLCASVLGSDGRIVLSTSWRTEPAELQDKLFAALGKHGVTRDMIVGKTPVIGVGMPWAVTARPVEPTTPPVWTVCSTTPSGVVFFGRWPLWSAHPDDQRPVNSRRLLRPQTKNRSCLLVLVVQVVVSLWGGIHSITQPYPCILKKSDGSAPLC